MFYIQGMAASDNTKTSHIGVRLSPEMVAQLDAARIDLCEQFAGVDFNQSDTIRLMLCGALAEMRRRKEWLREQVRGEPK